MADPSSYEGRTQAEAEARAMAALKDRHKRNPLLLPATDDRPPILPASLSIELADNPMMSRITDPATGEMVKSIRGFSVSAGVGMGLTKFMVEICPLDVVMHGSPTYEVQEQRLVDTAAMLGYGVTKAGLPVEDPRRPFKQILGEAAERAAADFIVRRIAHQPGMRLALVAWSPEDMGIMFRELADAGHPKTRMARRSDRESEWENTSQARGFVVQNEQDVRAIRGLEFGLVWVHGVARRHAPFNDIANIMGPQLRLDPGLWVLSDDVFYQTPPWRTEVVRL